MGRSHRSAPMLRRSLLILDVSINFPVKVLTVRVDIGSEGITEFSGGAHIDSHVCVPECCRKSTDRVADV